MDPTKPESFNHRVQVLSTGRKYHFVDQLPAGYNPDKSVPLILVHGFPDSWYATDSFSLEDECGLLLDIRALGMAGDT